MNTGRMSADRSTNSLDITKPIGVDITFKTDKEQIPPHLYAELLSKEDIEKAIRKIDPEENTIELLESWKQLKRQLKEKRRGQ